MVNYLTGAEGENVQASILPLCYFILFYFRSFLPCVLRAWLSCFCCVISLLGYVCDCGCVTTTVDSAELNR